MMLQVYAIWLRAWADTLQAMAPPAPKPVKTVTKLPASRPAVFYTRARTCHLRVVK